jgi:hypothetical protein
MAIKRQVRLSKFIKAIIQEAMPATEATNAVYAGRGRGQ